MALDRAEYNSPQFQPFSNSDPYISYSPSRKWEWFIFEIVQITKEFSNRDKIKTSKCSPEELEYQCLTFYLSITLAPKNECKNVIKTTCTIFYYEI